MHVYLKGKKVCHERFIIITFNNIKTVSYAFLQHISSKKYYSQMNAAPIPNWHLFCSKSTMETLEQCMKSVQNHKDTRTTSMSFCC